MLLVRLKRLLITLTGFITSWPGITTHSLPQTTKSYFRQAVIRLAQSAFQGDYKLSIARSSNTFGSAFVGSTANLNGGSTKEPLISTLTQLSAVYSYVRAFSKRTFGFSFYYLQGLCLVMFVDACLTDDEPLWEPIEWSLVQTWILFIFGFAWIAENLIVSRYGSYTGRDKRVWFAWYKSFWLIELWYIISYAGAITFVIVPFYFETSYSMSFVFSWWHWYSRVFFFKFISILTLVLTLAQILQLSVRWLNWRKGLLLVLLINVFLSYLVYTQFFITFFAYFTDPLWYQKTRSVDYVQLSHEPSRWGWGPAKKDHFTYHNVRTVFWFKNDGPFAAAFLMSQMFFFICLFLLYIYWIALFRRIYAMKEIPLTYTTYCVSSLRQFLYFFMLLYLFVFLSYISCYWRFPIEFLWSVDANSWLSNFVTILKAYPFFLLSLLGL